MTIATDYKPLSAIVREVWEEGEYHSVYDAIPAVLDEIPEELSRIYLHEALRWVVPNVHSVDRNRNFKSVRRGPEPVKGGYVETLLDAEGEEYQQPTESAFAKRDKVRDVFSAFMRNTIPTESRGQIRVEDATAEDLDFAADTRISQGRAFIKQGLEWRAVGAIMREVGAKRAGDLTPAQIAGIV